MAHTHEFDCPVCGSHCDSREQLELHRERAHHEGGKTAGGSDRPSEGSKSERDPTRRRDTEMY